VKNLNHLATPAAVGGATLVTTLIVLGSQGLRHFDWALLPYALAAIFCAAAVAYRCAAWFQRPPTKRYWQQSWRLYRAGRALANTAYVGQFAANNFAAQRFIARRGRLRWVTHLCLSWGTTLAFAITFPLVFGWIHFETPADDLSTYHVMFLGMKVQAFPVHSVIAFLTFNALNISAVLVLTGVCLALYRRLTDGGALALQRFGLDLVPLLLLFVVAASGLGLTVSAHFLQGRGFSFIALVHAASVIILLVSLPFGKLFHIFQRPLHLGVGLYKRAGQAGPPARCARCREPFASQLHINDLKQVLGELAIDNRLDGPVEHYQEICPPCRRRLLALNHGRNVGKDHGAPSFA
jgi:MFS transporter, NNP family, nitrate/nitrite transporter